VFETGFCPDGENNMMPLRDSFLFSAPPGSASISNMQLCVVVLKAFLQATKSIRCIVKLLLCLDSFFPKLFYH
jgi:hypothetical protein